MILMIYIKYFVYTILFDRYFSYDIVIYNYIIHPTLDISDYLYLNPIVFIIMYIHVHNNSVFQKIYTSDIYFRPLISEI